MFGEDESESPRVPSPWESIIELSRISTPSEGRTPSPLASEMERLPPENDEGSIEYKLRLLHPSPARFTRLVTQLKWRLLEGGGRALYELGVADDGELVGLDKNDMEETVGVLSEMADELGARVWVVRQVKVRVGKGAEGTRVFSDDTCGPSTLDNLENLDTPGLESEATFVPSVLGNLHIYDVFNPRPVKVRTRLRTGTQMPTSTLPSKFTASSSNNSDAFLGGVASASLGAKYYHKSRQKEGKKEFQLNHLVLGSGGLTNECHLHSENDNMHTQRVCVQTQKKPIGTSGTHTRTQTHNHARDYIQTRNVRNIHSGLIHRNSNHIIHSNSSRLNTPHILGSGVGGISHRPGVNDPYSPLNRETKATRGGRGNRREARDRRRAEKAQERENEKKKIEARGVGRTCLLPARPFDSLIFGVNALNVNVDFDVIDGDAVVSTSLEINTDKEEIFCAPRAGTTEATHDASVRVNAETLHDKGDHNDIHEDANLDETEVKVEIGIRANTDRTNVVHDHDAVIQSNAHSNRPNGVNGVQPAHPTQTFTHRPAAEGLGERTSGNCRVNEAGIGGEVEGNERYKFKGGDDEEEPRLIIEALVIRNFEIGEAFLDFGGFRGLGGVG